MSARRRWAWPIVPLYRGAVAAEDATRRAGVLRTQRLGWPVVSVGSLSAGGAGKTPVVIALARLLRSRGWQVDVLSRGYGRQGGGVERVVRPELHVGEAARRFGDEPVVIAERTGVPVWVGADRFAAGKKAEAEAGTWSGEHRRAYRDQRHEDDAERAAAGDVPQIASQIVSAAAPPLRVHLLDDGFQHRQLARDFDIVLLTREDLEDVLLPAGNLRAPLSYLARADAIAVREEELQDIAPRVRELTGGQVPLWSVRRRLHFPAPLGVFSAGLRPVAFCAIARPEGFAFMLAEAGCGIVETVAFPDHHAYTVRDIDHMLKVARGLDASGFVTTEKDAVKLSPVLRQRLETLGPLIVVKLNAEFVYKSPVVRTIEDRLRARNSVPPSAPKETQSRGPASPTHEERTR